jgi:chromosomal replication initiation ATPase DnaA
MAQDDQMFNPEQVPLVDDGQREPRPVFRDKEIIKAPLPELVILVSELCNVAAIDITGQSRQREVVAARRVLVQFCINYTLISQGELVTALGFSDSTVSKAANFRSEDVSANVSKLLNKLKRKA